MVVTTLALEVDYAVNEGALPLSAVDLWYTRDEGTTWHHAVADEDRISPIVFHAPADGSYGLLVIAGNAASGGGAPPSSGTVPHLLVLIDATPPELELEPIQLGTAGGQPTLQIRWLARDDQFVAKPIEIDYQAATSVDQWTRATSEPLANSGRLDWTPPAGLSGAVLLRVSATDQGGHVTAKTQRVAIPIPVATTSPATLTPVTENAAAITGSKRAKERAARLLADAGSLRDRGAYREAVGRVREAVQLHPGLTEAFIELGELLHELGDTEEALRVFEIALKQQPNLRSALLGTARLHLQARSYPLADQQFRTILRYNPVDAEVLLQLGDVAVYRGDELSARDYYARAISADASATKVIADAQKRLFIMDENARKLRREKP